MKPVATKGDMRYKKESTESADHLSQLMVEPAVSSTLFVGRSLQGFASDSLGYHQSCEVKYRLLARVCSAVTKMGGYVQGCDQGLAALGKSNGTYSSCHKHRLSQMTKLPHLLEHRKK